jgi:hypothetical protein
MLVKLKQEGKSKVQHKLPLSKEDLQKLYDQFDMDTPSGLQNKVFVDFMHRHLFLSISFDTCILKIREGREVKMTQNHSPSECQSFERLANMPCKCAYHRSLL